MADIYDYKLSELLTVITASKFQEIKRIERIEKAILDYGDITYKEYKVKRYRELEDMTETEIEEIKKYIPNDEEGTDFTEEMRDMGMLAPLKEYGG